MQKLIKELESLEPVIIENNQYILRDDILKLIEKNKIKKLTPNTNVYILHKQGEISNELQTGMYKAYFKMKYSKYQQLLKDVEIHKKDLLDYEADISGGGIGCILNYNLYKLFTKAEMLRERPLHIEEDSYLKDLI